MKATTRGQILPMVIAALLVMTIFTYGLVRWLQHDMMWAVKQTKGTSAVNLAEAGLDRGQWKLQSTTTTWESASGGTVIAGYNFDTTYRDIPGGSYRIRFTTAANNSITIVSEGRDSSTKEVRALSGTYRNQTIYSPLMAGSNVTWSAGLLVFWGAILSQGNITMMDNTVAGIYYPRKYAKNVVSGTVLYPRDTNGLTTPNTDNVEWWSQYTGVPDVPVLDFSALRSSAAITTTLNIYGCRSTQGGAGALGHATRWDTRAACSSSGLHTTHFGNPWSHSKSARTDPKDYVWYWDGDVVLSGASGSNQSCGLKGIIVVRGSLTIDTPGEYTYTGHVPTNAWEEHQKFTSATFDTAATRQYPADAGYHATNSTFQFGTDTFGVPGLGAGPYINTVGIKGFTYVGGNLTILKYLDFHGAVWVNGTVTASGGSLSNSCGIFYDDTLDVPALNVILQRTNWKEISPSSTVWP